MEKRCVFDKFCIDIYIYIFFFLILSEIDILIPVVDQLHIN